jgi:hypothetical protein
VKVLFHHRCFDGVTSAALFSRFYREHIDAGAEFAYLGLTHQAGDSFPPDAFSEEQQACVDFRYHRSPRLTWWFDHHQSAFPTAEDEAHFRADQSGHKFYDPKARSCSKFLADTVTRIHGFDQKPLAELIEWADIIDSASFKTPQQAVGLEAPALKLMAALENADTDAFVEGIIRQITERPLAELAAEPDVVRRVEPILERNFKYLDLVKQRAEVTNGVVFFDLSDQGQEGVSKFIPYALFPDCRYVVSVMASPARSKVSVGSNPWSSIPRTHNIASICERYGGGGHPVVGAISLGKNEIDRARTVAREIVEELGRG